MKCWEKRNGGIMSVS